MSNVNIDSLLRENIRQLKPYSSARDEFEGDGSIFLDANESPVPMVDLPKGINRYPDPLQKTVKAKLAKLKGVAPNGIFLGNGSDEAVDLLFRCFCNPGLDNVVVFPPTYGMYEVCAAINQVEVVTSQLDENFNINVDDFWKKVNNQTKLVFICNPNNPSGNTQQRSTIEEIAKSFNGLVVVDEAYIDFCAEESLVPRLNSYPNLVVLQTFSKAWGLAGARLGIAFADSKIIAAMNKVKFPYNVGLPAIALAEKALSKVEELQQRVAETKANKEWLVEQLSSIPGVERIYPSKANFLLVKTASATKIYQNLISNGIVVRDRSSQPGCGSCLRVTVGNAEENSALVAVWSNIKNSEL